MKIKKSVFLGGLVVFCLPFFALADEPVAKIKMINAPQIINTSTPSGVFTLEAQDSSGNKVNVASTTRVSLVSSSSSGQFLTSSASGPCSSATTTSVTISNNTSHKSFCYTDPTAGNYTISISVPDQPIVLGDTQPIIISGADQSASTTTTSTVFSTLVKIHRFMPNPAGEDSGSEWVEIKNSDAQDVSLDGWLLDDKGTTPADSAFALAGSIASGET
ncbi:MAG TPA: lamin tail domain-containing protein, partial [Candidatus Limnocylindria bacterium]|nr:lamin tail domain-containing protein [Candidatus Limnocylindria bacterium]